MKKTKTRIARILAAMLCICIMCPCMTAFAMADDANAGIEPPAVTTVEETEPDKESEDTEAEELTPEEKLKEYLSSYGLSWDELMKLLDVDENPTGTVVTNGGRLNVRSGGGMDYEILERFVDQNQSSPIL